MRTGTRPPIRLPHTPKSRRGLAGERQSTESDSTFWCRSGRCPIPLPLSKPFVQLGGGAKGSGPSGTDLGGIGCGPACTFWYGHGRRPH
eukprot:4014711-Pleurochrysis_carterae.AAC.1